METEGSSSWGVVRIVGGLVGWLVGWLVGCLGIGRMTGWVLVGSLMSPRDRII